MNGGEKWRSMGGHKRRPWLRRGGKALSSFTWENADTDGVSWSVLLESDRQPCDPPSSNLTESLLLLLFFFFFFYSFFNIIKRVGQYFGFYPIIFNNLN